MSKRFSSTGLLAVFLLLALSVAMGARAAEVLASPAPASPQVSGCPASSSTNALDSVTPVAPSWMQAMPIPCGPGCPAIGKGTDPSCTGKKTGDACGTAGGFCLQLLSPTCPRSNVQCICYQR
jgi:hypothetical protein